MYASSLLAARQRGVKQLSWKYKIFILILALSARLKRATCLSREGRGVATSRRAKVRAAYPDFLALWKDADSDVPILKEAKAEYEKLR
jgi:hypothetical protein